MVPKLTLFTALVFATYPAHALDLKKELERLRGGADAKETQTHATSADAVGRAAPAAAAILGRAAFLDASRVAPPLSRLGAIVKPKDPYAFECNPYKHKTCFEGQRQCRNGKKVFDDIRPCDDGEFLNNPPGVELGNGGFADGCFSCPVTDDPLWCFALGADLESVFDCLGCCFPDAFGTKQGLLAGACTSCGYSEDAGEVDNMWDCLTCEEGFEIIPLFEDCTGLCVKSGRSVRTFKEMGFADLATSACTAYVDCYGGDDRKGVKVLPADDDDFFDDDLYEVLGRD